MHAVVCVLSANVELWHKMQVGSRCALRVNGWERITGALAASNTAFMAPVVTGRANCGKAAVAAAMRGNGVSNTSIRWSAPATPVLANTAPRLANGSCPFGYATYDAGGTLIHTPTSM